MLHKTGGVSMQRWGKKISKVIIFSQILWKSLPALGFEAEPVTSAWNAESGAQTRYKQRSCPVLKLPETSPSGGGAGLEPSSKPSQTEVRGLSLRFTGKFSIAYPSLVSQMREKRPFGKLILIIWLKGNLLLSRQGYSIWLHKWERVCDLQDCRRIFINYNVIEKNCMQGEWKS